MSKRHTRLERPGTAFQFRDFLSVKDLTASELLELLGTAQLVKRKLRQGQKYQPLAGRTLAMIFQKPSLRTRVSFETGMTQLGGHAIYLGPDDIRLGQRESVEDVAITLSRMADLIMARVFGHDIVEELARHATVPVINALSDREHPCQALGDLLTILEHHERLEGLRLTYIGDGNNVCHSLLYGAAMLGMRMTVAGPIGFEPRAAIVEDARRIAAATGGSIAITDSMAEACLGADVLYTDVWASMGQEAEAEARRALFRPFQVNEAALELASRDAILMHCLPAHYGEEIEYAASRSKASVIFDQAENRLHAQKALMVMLAA